MRFLEKIVWIVMLGATWVFISLFILLIVPGRKKK